MTRLSGQRNFLVDSGLGLSLVLLAMVFYSALFLHVPVLTEVRDFLAQYGWGARLADVFIPSGNDYRPLSWSFFAWQHSLFPYNAEAVNLVQFVLLGLGALLAFIHVRQLLGNRYSAFATGVFWLISLPAIHAAFWQATQHDKLAFIFILLTLSVSFHAIRLDRPKLIPAFTLLLLALVAVAVATKPVAFMLPGALVAQMVLFTPRRNRSAHLRAAALIAMPTAYAIVYIVGYLMKMTPEWQAHATGWNIVSNIFIYIRSVTNIDYDGRLWIALLLFFPVGLAWGRAVWIWGMQFLAPKRSAQPDSGWGNERDAVLVYLAAIFIGGIIVLARARHPTAFYVLLPMFAFITSLVTIATPDRRNANRLNNRYVVMIVSLVVAGMLLNCWVNTSGPSRLGQWRRAAVNLSNGYEVLRNTVDPEQIESITFLLPDDPMGYFYFFSDGLHQDIDPAIPAFIFRENLAIPINNRFAELPAPSVPPGELVALWSDGLELLETRFAGIDLYKNPDATTWPAVYATGRKLGFGKNGQGVRYLAEGWSWQEDSGTWTDGDKAEIVMKLDHEYQIPLVLLVSAQAFITDGHPRQDVDVFANDQPVAHWTFQHGDPALELQALIPTEIVNQEYLKLGFHLLSPRSPASLELSSDGRKLGIMLHELQIRALSPNGGPD